MYIRKECSLKLWPLPLDFSVQSSVGSDPVCFQFPLSEGTVAVCMAQTLAAWCAHRRRAACDRTGAHMWPLAAYSLPPL